MDSLCRLATEMNITIIYVPLNYTNKDLFGLHSPASNTIFLDANLLRPENYKLHRGILAEEIGHRVTGTTCNSLNIHTNFSMARKITEAHKSTEDEKRALRWATEKLIPAQELIPLLYEGYSCEDLSDYFGVTAWFIFRALEFLQLECSEKEVHPIIKLAKISCI